MIVSTLRTGDGVAIWFRDLNSIDTSECVSFVDVDARIAPGQEIGEHEVLERAPSGAAIHGVNDNHSRHGLEV